VETRSGTRRTRAVYYRDPSGHEPVDEFIDSVRPDAAQTAIDKACDYLNGLSESAPPLAFPHSSRIEGELRELRCHYGRRLFRILYQRSKNLFVLLHALEKYRGPIARTDIAIAQQRFAEFRVRMDAARRVPPRAAGHDAPPITRSTRSAP
jgi:phage-related protein